MRATLATIAGNITTGFITFALWVFITLPLGYVLYQHFILMQDTVSFMIGEPVSAHVGIFAILVAWMLIARWEAHTRFDFLAPTAIDKVLSGLWLLACFALIGYVLFAIAKLGHPSMSFLDAIALGLVLVAAVDDVRFNGDRRTRGEQKAVSASAENHTEGSQAIQLALGVLAEGKKKGDSIIAIVAVGDKSGELTVSKKLA